MLQSRKCHIKVSAGLVAVLIMAHNILKKRIGRMQNQTSPEHRVHYSRSRQAGKGLELHRVCVCPSALQTLQTCLQGHGVSAHGFASFRFPGAPSQIPSPFDPRD